MDLLSALVDRSMVVAEPGPDSATGYRLLETLRQISAGDRYRPNVGGDDAGPAPGPLPVSGRALVRPPVERRGTRGKQGVRRGTGTTSGPVDWALATGRRRVADLLHATYWFAFHAGRWEHREWAVAVLATGADTGKIASAAVAVWDASCAIRHRCLRVLAALDPTAPDLVARDVEQIWMARTNTRVHQPTYGDELERAADWLREREPRCGDPITEAWLLANVINCSFRPHPALVARLHRLAQASASPSVQAIAGFTLHGGRYENPRLGEGLDLGDIVDGLQHATLCSKAAGNLYVEVTCMMAAAIPLTDRGERRDAAAPRHARADQEIRYDPGLAFFAPRLAVWLVLIGRPDVACVVDGWLRSHVDAPLPSLQPALARLDQLVDTSSFPDARSRGVTMTSAELIDYLVDVLGSVADETVKASEQAIASSRP